MTIYVAYSCIDLIIVKIICRTFIVVILNKIMNYTTTIHEIPPCKLHVSYQRTNYRKYTVFNKGISLWNCLNEDIKNIKPYFSLKKNIKLHYLLSV